MTVTAEQIAAWVGGELAGDGSVAVTGVGTLDDAEPGDITFLDHARKAKRLADSPAAAAVVPRDTPAADNGPTLIRADDPLIAFLTAVQKLRGDAPAAPPAGVDPTASVHPSAKIAPTARVEMHCVVGEGCVVGPGCLLRPGVVLGRGCTLGEGVTLHPYVVLYDHSKLGDRVTVHAHTTIGADGFGYRQRDGRHEKVPQVGSVEVGDDVEIGAGCAIDRGTFAATRVGAGTKIDNLVQVGHNCVVGGHNLLVSQVGLGGSVTTGDYAVLAGQAGVADHNHVGTGAIVGAQGGVVADVPDGFRGWGTPLQPIFAYKRAALAMMKLPELIRQVGDLRRRLGAEETSEAA